MTQIVQYALHVVVVATVMMTAAGASIGIVVRATSQAVAEVLVQWIVIWRIVNMHSRVLGKSYEIWSYRSFCKHSCSWSLDHGNTKSLLTSFVKFDNVVPKFETEKIREEDFSRSVMVRPPNHTITFEESEQLKVNVVRKI